MNGIVSHLKDKHGRRSWFREGGHGFRLRHVDLELPSKDPGEDVKKSAGYMVSEPREEARATGTTCQQM